MDASKVSSHPSPRVQVVVSEDPIDPAELIGSVADPASGATAVFLGTVRNHSPGKEGVTHLDYEVYEGRVQETLERLIGEAAARWPLLAVAVRHRHGPVMVGEASVAVAVSSAHRVDAFAGAQFLIDELKAQAPIWKKEFWPGGEEWSKGS